MKTHVLMLTCILAIFSGGCTGDSPTQPQDVPGPAPLTSGTIGPEGGTLRAEGFSITVPQGCFGEPTTLEVFASSLDSPFGNDAVSPMYRIEGIPGEQAWPIVVTLKYSGSLRHSTFLAIGTMGFAHGSDTVGVGYRMVEAIDSAGTLTARLAPQPLLSRSSSARSTRKPGDVEATSMMVQGVTAHFSHTSAQGHFKILYRPEIITLAKAQDLANAFEWAFTNLKEAGYDFAGRRPWPADVTIMPLEFPVYGKYLSDMAVYGYFQFDQDVVSNNTQVWSTAGHEFFHLVHDCYDPRSAFKRQVVPSAQLWLEEAAATWYEEKCGSNPFNPSFVPTAFPDKEDAPFRGMHMGAGQSWLSTDDATRHGYGMASMIKYLVKTHGELIVRRMFEAIKAEAHVIDAVLGSVPVPVNEWWPEFFRSYMNADIYSVASDRFLGIASGQFQVMAETDTQKQFSTYYYDLSARLFRVPVRHTQMSPDTKIQFTASSSTLEATDLCLLVFVLKDNLLRFHARGNPVTVMNVKEMATAANDLVVVVVNSHAGRPVDQDYVVALDVKVIRPTGPRQASIQIWMNGAIEWSDGSVDTSVVWYNPRSSAVWRTGTLEGNIFRTTWEPMQGHEPSTGNWEIRFDFTDPDRPEVDYFQVSETNVSAGETQTYTIRSISPANIIGYRRQIGGWAFEVSGRSSSEKIEYFQEEVLFQGGYSRHLKGNRVFALDDSYIYVYLD